MKTIAVLGSGVLKKAFNFLDNKLVKPILYAPKLSIAALNGDEPGSNVDRLRDEKLDLFTRSVLQRDFGKTFLSELSDLNPDYLFIDMLDNFFDLLVNQETGCVITKSSYLALINQEEHGLNNWSAVERNSEAGWSLLKKGCENLYQHLPKNTQIILVRTFQPESYIGKGDPQSYSPTLLDRIRKNNAVLEHAYSLVTEYFKPIEIELPTEIMISQTVESQGFNPTNLSESTQIAIAREIALAINIEESILPSREARMDALFELFSPALKQEAPSIYELHLMGRTYLEKGDIDRAKWAERLIVLLKNSSVPLSVEMGRVMFAYGGIGVVVHSQCKIGDFVNIGSNVTLGGGRAQVDSQGKMRKVPHVGNHVYIASGAKLLGGITVGNYSIIGANAVVNRDVPPLSVVVGNPGKVATTITPDNLYKYASYFYKGVALKDVARMIFG